MQLTDSKQHHKYLGVGQMCLFVGILTQRFIAHHLFDRLVRVEWIADALTYLFSLEAAILIGVSIVFNLKALNYRRQK